MLKIRDLGINILPVAMPPSGKAAEYWMGYMGTEECPDMTCSDYFKTPSKYIGTEECPDMTCSSYYKKPTKKKPAKKAPAKKKPSKKTPTKKRRASGFGTAAVMQLGRQLEEQLRNEH